MSEAENAQATLATLQAEIRALCENVQRLSNVVEQNTAQLSKLAVLEEKHNNQSQALDRAFASVRHLEEDMTQHGKDDVVVHDKLAAQTEALKTDIALQLKEVKEANDKDHKWYDRAINISLGFMLAVSVGWTIFGFRLQHGMDEFDSTRLEMLIYLRTHKQVTP